MFSTRSTIILFYYMKKKLLPEAVTRKCSVKQILIKISQSSQENTCGSVSFVIKLYAGHTGKVGPRNLRCDPKVGP